jgi:hypothetical protein
MPDFLSEEVRELIKKVLVNDPEVGFFMTFRIGMEKRRLRVWEVEVLLLFKCYCNSIGTIYQIYEATHGSA